MMFPFHMIVQTCSINCALMKLTKSQTLICMRCSASNPSTPGHHVQRCAWILWSLNFLQIPIGECLFWNLRTEMNESSISKPSTLVADASCRQGVAPVWIATRGGVLHAHLAATNCARRIAWTTITLCFLLETREIKTTKSVENLGPEGRRGGHNQLARARSLGFHEEKQRRGGLSPHHNPQGHPPRGIQVFLHPASQANPQG